MSVEVWVSGETENGFEKNIGKITNNKHAENNTECFADGIYTGKHNDCDNRTMLIDLLEIPKEILFITIKIKDE